MKIPAVLGGLMLALPITTTSIVPPSLPPLSPEELALYGLHHNISHTLRNMTGREDGSESAAAAQLPFRCTQSSTCKSAEETNKCCESDKQWVENRYTYCPGPSKDAAGACKVRQNEVSWCCNDRYRRRIEFVFDKADYWGTETQEVTYRKVFVKTTADYRGRVACNEIGGYLDTSWCEDHRTHPWFSLDEAPLVCESWRQYQVPGVENTTVWVHGGNWCAIQDRMVPPITGPRRHEFDNLWVYYKGLMLHAATDCEIWRNRDNIAENRNLASCHFEM